MTDLHSRTSLKKSFSFCLVFILIFFHQFHIERRATVTIVKQYAKALEEIDLKEFHCQNSIFIITE